jgi:hypothetical protein
MHRRSTITMGMLFAGLSVLPLSSQAAEQAGGMVTLTDGKSTNNFDKVGDANWRIAEGAVVANQGRGFLVTKQAYDNFRLRAEFYPDDETDSGIFIRCQDPQRPSAQSCYEVNIYDTNTNRDNVTGAIVNIAKVERMPQTELNRPTICEGRHLFPQSRNSATVGGRYRGRRPAYLCELPGRVRRSVSE